MTPIKRPNDMLPNTEMVVTALKKHEGQYGPSYILKDAEANAMWSNSKINEFIQKHKETVPFTVRFLERQTFCKGGDNITYTPVTVTAA